MTVINTSNAVSTTVSGNTIVAGGTDVVTGLGSDRAFEIDNGGSILLSGTPGFANVSGGVVLAGGHLTVNSGNVINVSVSGGTVDMSGSGTQIGITSYTQNGGTLNVSFGGTTANGIFSGTISNTTVNATNAVFASGTFLNDVMNITAGSGGGTIRNTTIAGGTVNVFSTPSSGGNIANDTITSGATVVAHSGTFQSSNIVQSGGILSMTSGAIATDFTAGTVSSGGTLILDSGVQNNSTSTNLTVTLRGGTVIQGAQTYADPNNPAVGARGVVYQMSGANNPTGSIIIHGTVANGGVLNSAGSISWNAGANQVPTIDFPDIAVQGTLGIAYTPGGGNVTATITNGSQTYTIQLFAPPAGLRLIADGSGGFQIVCFLAGTLIATPDGERAVEALQEGDLVLTASGDVKPVTWLGHRTVRTAELRNAGLNLPVRIAQDAIAPGKPARDLLVTADHSIFVEGRLVPVKLLVNGKSIRQEAMEVYTYYHVELADHDLLLAEGLEAESYLDVVDSRTRFANNAVVARDPSLTITDLTVSVYAEKGCHPISLDGATVQPIWQKLADRAAASEDGEWTSDPALRLRAGASILKPEVQADGLYAFDLPAEARDVTIQSRSASPWQRRPWIDDRRMLGVAIAKAICVLDNGHEVELDLAAWALGEGWHDLEQSGDHTWRWTKGSAALAIPPQTRQLKLKLQGTVDYPARVLSRDFEMVA